TSDVRSVFLVSLHLPFRSIPFSPFFFFLLPPPPSSPLFPYTTLFRSRAPRRPNHRPVGRIHRRSQWGNSHLKHSTRLRCEFPHRSEEHTSELQSRFDLVCRLLLEKKKRNNTK